MYTIKELQSKMRSFDTFAKQQVIDNKSPEPALQRKWTTLFDDTLDPESAKSFTKYYRSMRSKNNSRKSQSGGSAPLDYVMAPGLNPQEYGRFPVAINTDPQSIQDLDVYFQNSLTKGCGIENSSLTIPEGMGSNMVGGSRKNRKNNRKASRKVNRKASRKMNRKASRKANRKANRKASRKMNRKASRKNRKNQRGGLIDYTNLGASLYSRPFLASAPPNMFQAVNAVTSGATSPVPVSSSPSSHTWGYVSRGTDGIINPGNITAIGDNFEKLASPAPWQTQN